MNTEDHPDPTAAAAWQHLCTHSARSVANACERAGILSIPDYYGEDPRLGLYRVVVGQQVSTQAASAMFADLMQRANHNNAQLLALLRSDAPTKLSQTKRATLTYLAGLPDAQIAQWLALDYPQRNQAMTQTRGVGPWTVAMWSMFVCKDADVWSQGDLVLRRQADAFASQDNRVASDIVAEAAPYRTYFALLCWQLADTKR